MGVCYGASSSAIEIVKDQVSIGSRVALERCNNSTGITPTNTITIAGSEASAKRSSLANR
jgi:hypothetical protein